MRRLIRPNLAANVEQQLAWQTKRIRKLRTHRERVGAANSNWVNATGTKENLLIALESMTGGHDRCMYCEYSEGGTIDHFCPRATDPKQTFHWRNLLLACQRCQNAKGSQFKKQLLNPTSKRYRPWDHFHFDPKTGDYIPQSQEAKFSETVYKWYRGQLATYRRNSFGTFQAAIIAYAIAKQAGDIGLAEEQQRRVRTEPHPGIFDWILHWCDEGPPASPGKDPLDTRVREAVATYPEIRRWLAT